MTARQPEIELLLCCARTALDDATLERARALLARPLDWAWVTRTAAEHAVMPLLCRSLSNRCPDAVPRAVLDPLQDQFRRNARRNLAVTRQLLELLERLESAGIPTLPFKGPVLATTVYGDLTLRQINDLDLLVRLRDLPRARAVLQAAGYRRDSPPPRRREAAHLRAHHHDTFQREQAVAVELHWRFAPAHLPFPLDLEHLWQRLEQAPLPGATVRSLPAEDLLLILCIHGFSHGWTRLNWICDVAELLRAHPGIDGDRLLRHARSLHSERKLLLGLRLAADLLAAPLPAGIHRPSESDAVIRSLAVAAGERLFAPADEAARVTATFFLHLRTLERLTDRVRCALHFARRRRFLDAQDPRPRPVPLRPLRLLCRYQRQIRRCLSALVER